MFRLDSEEALQRAFRPKDREAVEPAPGLTFPRFVRHSLAWAHPSGGRVYLVFAVRRGPATGIVFETSTSASPPVAQLCDWCHGFGLGGQVALLTARVNANRRVGVQVCSDLSCAQKLEDQADRLGVSAVPALEALLARIGRFASEGLGIDLSGGGR